MRIQGSRLTVLAAWRSAIQARGEDSRRTTTGAAEDRRLQISRTRCLGKGGPLLKITQMSLIHSNPDKMAAQDYTADTLKKISELLNRNPEYYTIWNHRRQAMRHQFAEAGDSTDESTTQSALQLIKNDLMFLIPLLRSFPKCYWIWNYRLWLLDEARRLLALPEARQLWQEEFFLVGKMLTLDSRNFHGWGYRRLVVETLKQLGTPEEAMGMTQKEFEYAKKMIGANLSNFSAWHYRTKLIQRLLDEQRATDDERKTMLDEGQYHKAAV